MKPSVKFGGGKKKTLFVELLFPTHGHLKRDPDHSAFFARCQKPKRLQTGLIFNNVVYFKCVVHYPLCQASNLRSCQINVWSKVQYIIYLSGVEVSYNWNALKCTLRIYITWLYYWFSMTGSRTLYWSVTGTKWNNIDMYWFYLHTPRVKRTLRIRVGDMVIIIAEAIQCLLQRYFIYCDTMREIQQINPVELLIQMHCSTH